MGKIPRRNPIRGNRALQAERAEKVPKNKVRGKLWEDKTEHTTHGAVGSNGGERDRQRMPKIEKKSAIFRTEGRETRVAMTTIPGAVDSPLGLVVHPGGSTPAEGKLMSHRRREAKGDMKGSQLKHVEVLVKTMEVGLSSRCLRCGRTSEQPPEGPETRGAEAKTEPQG